MERCKSFGPAIDGSTGAMVESRLQEIPVRYVNGPSQASTSDCPPTFHGTNAQSGVVECRIVAVDTIRDDHCPGPTQDGFDDDASRSGRLGDA